MQKLIILILIVISINLANAQGNALDTRFGNGGKVATNTQPYADETAYSVTCQSDGKIVIGGFFGITSQQISAAAVRYKENGDIDPTFGTQGIALLSADGGNTQGFAAAIQKAGNTENIIIAGNYYVPFGNGYSILLGRYTPSGSLDPSFGINGKAMLQGTSAGTLLIDSMGRLLLPGRDDTVSGGTAFGVFRLLPNGDRDYSFGVAGYALKPDSIFGTSQAIALQKDGKILVGGRIFRLPQIGHPGLGIVRYLQNGIVDSSFGSDGLVRLSPDTSVADLYDLAVQPDGKILACGVSDTGTGKRFYVTRLMPEGTTDATFGLSGVVRTDFGNSQSWASKILVHSDQKIYAVGQAIPFGTGDYRFAVARYKQDGSLDQTFGVNGLDTSLIGNYCGATTATITPRQSLVAAGWSYWSLPLGRFNDYTLMQYRTGLELGIVGPGHQIRLNAYPNPVNSDLTVSYELKKEDWVGFCLADMTGRTVQLFNSPEQRASGRHQDVLHIDPSVISGMYLLQITTGSGTANIKLCVVK